MRGGCITIFLSLTLAPSRWWWCVCSSIQKKKKKKRTKSLYAETCTMLRSMCCCCCYGGKCMYRLCTVVYALKWNTCSTRRFPYILLFAIPFIPIAFAIWSFVSSSIIFVNIAFGFFMSNFDFNSRTHTKPERGKHCFRYGKHKEMHTVLDTVLLCVFLFFIRSFQMAHI